MKDINKTKVPLVREIRLAWVRTYVNYTHSKTYRERVIDTKVEGEKGLYLMIGAGRRGAVRTHRKDSEGGREVCGI